MCALKYINFILVLVERNSAGGTKPLIEIEGRFIALVTNGTTYYVYYRNLSI